MKSPFSSLLLVMFVGSGCTVLGTSIDERGTRGDTLAIRSHFMQHNDNTVGRMASAYCARQGNKKPRLLSRADGCLLACGTEQTTFQYQCVTDDQLYAEQQQSAMRVEQEDHSRCVSFGLVRGSDTYANCRLRLLEMRSSEQTRQTQASAKSAELTRASDTRARSVEICKAMMFGMPTKSGSFGESAMNALRCEGDPQAHVSTVTDLDGIPCCGDHVA